MALLLRSRLLTRGLALLLLTFATPLLAGVRSFAPAVPAADPAPREAADVLHVRLQAAEARFEAALRQWSPAHAEAGRREMSAALAELRVLSEQCRALPGCDLARVLGLWQTLVERQQQALLRPAESVPTAPLPVVDAPPPPEYPAAADTARLLAGTDLKEMIRLNGPVKAAIADWLTIMRPNLIETWKNYSFLRHRMYPHFERGGLPEALLFGILARESLGRVHAMSRSGAAGPMQFMPATAKRLGIPPGDGRFDPRMDPAEAARASAAYINEQLSRFNRSLELTLAAYNGGEGRVGRMAERHGTGAFWSSRFLDELPTQTREYVPKVLAAAYLFLHPEEFNLRFPELDTAPAQLVLRRAASLAELSICLGQGDREEGWFRTLRNLNPRLKPQQRLLPGAVVQVPRAVLPDYELHCQDSRFMARIAALRDARYPAEVPYTAYTVRAGDSLADIADRHRCRDIREIAAVNTLDPPLYRLQVGQSLQVPVCGKTAPAGSARSLAGP
ncbi:MAG: transglycosylase SLT domain-containing protein [Xanthomonadales bacterium]|nr:transglycosylase SLT domain-containing protein [Xanthomonadales bacterium]